MVTPEAVVIAPPARLMGLLPKNSAGLTQFSRNFRNNGTFAPRIGFVARPKERNLVHGHMKAHPRSWLLKSTQTMQAQPTRSLVVVSLQASLFCARYAPAISGPCSRSQHP